MLDQRKTETKYIFYLIIGAGIYLKLYLCLGLPRFIYGHAVHDDSLLLNYANGLLTHNWLGAYSNLALNKMPGYSRISLEKKMCLKIITMQIIRLLKN